MLTHHIGVKFSVKLEAERTKIKCYDIVTEISKPFVCKYLIYFICARLIYFRCVL